MQANFVANLSQALTPQHYVTNLYPHILMKLMLKYSSLTICAYCCIGPPQLDHKTFFTKAWAVLKCPYLLTNLGIAQYFSSLPPSYYCTILRL
jgi:hypothetical protein